MRYQDHVFVTFVAAVGLAVTMAPVGALAEPWHYRLGEPRPEQQVNLCATRTDMDEVLFVFRRFGARPGYAALSNAPGCGVEVVALTPLQVVESLVISKGEPGEYRLSFVKVDLAGSETRYLVTTRDVREE